jgi:antirestriction protein ArdC
MSRNLYAEVSARIVAELETGAAPWVKPWRATAGANVPCNAMTNRPYSGCNVVLLWLAASAGYPTPRYLTFNQAKELGGNVRKGEHGTKVYFVKQLIVKDKDDADHDRVVPMLREYTVFNVAQCDGLPERILHGKPVAVRNPDERDATADEFLAATRADIREQPTDRACYHVGADWIEMPLFSSFKSGDNFYATAFHELAHWTGASHRYAREFGQRFGDMRYAAEELVAELTAAFLCAEFNMDGDLRHAGYLASWIKLLKDDNRAFFTACSKAQAAADYLRGKAIAEPEAIAA